MLQFISGWLISFRNLFIYVNNSQYTIRCSIVGINGKIDPLSEYDEVDEEVIYSQESPNMVEFYRDFDWELDRFVEYRSPFTRKETPSHQLKNHFRF